ncbi:hypothetical protein ACM66B_005727 [Microbotryomycetes sp. NB124-2]
MCRGMTAFATGCAQEIRQRVRIPDGVKADTFWLRVLNGDHNCLRRLKEASSRPLTIATLGPYYESDYNSVWKALANSNALPNDFHKIVHELAEIETSRKEAKDRDSDSDDCRSDLNTLRRAYEEVRHWWRHDYFKIVGLLENEQVLPRHIQEQIKVCRAVNYDRATSNPCSDSIANDYRLCIDRVSKLDEKYRADYEVHAYVQNLVAVLKGTTMKDADSWNALFRRQPAAVNKLIEAARALKKSVSSRGCLVVRGRTPDQPLPQVWQQPSSVNTKREGRVGYRSGNPSNLSTRSDPNLRISFGANRFVVPPFTLSSSSTWPDGGRQASAAYASGRRG